MRFPDLKRDTPRSRTELNQQRHNLVLVTRSLFSLFFSLQLQYSTSRLSWVYRGAIQLLLLPSSPVTCLPIWIRPRVIPHRSISVPPVVPLRSRPLFLFLAQRRDSNTYSTQSTAVRSRAQQRSHEVIVESFEPLS